MYEVPVIQEVPDINTSPFLDKDELKLALLAQKVSGVCGEMGPAL